MTQLKKISFLFFFFVISWNLTAQEYETWNSISVEKDFKKWNFSTTGELRTQDFYSQVNKWSLELDGSYQILSFLKIGAAYKFIDFYDQKYDDFQPRHRFAAYTSGKLKIDRFTFSLKEKIELTTKDESDRIKKNGTINTYKINPESYWRNKLKVGYNIPGIRLYPSLSIESFYQLNNPDGNVFDQMRYLMEFEYKINKKHSINLFGLIKKEINVSSPTTTYVGGLSYTISL